MDKGKIAYDGRPEEVFRQDLERIGVFEPPLVRFSHRFGLPYFRSVVDIGQNEAWGVERKNVPAAHGAPIASVRDIHYRYSGTNVDVLKGVTLDLYRGEIVAIMGANGSGKTTLVKHLNGLFRPYKGQVLLKGQDIEGRTVVENARSVGYVFQNVNHQFFEETVLGESCSPLPTWAWPEIRRWLGPKR